MTIVFNNNVDKLRTSAADYTKSMQEGVNMYAYGDNNPVNKRDSSGLGTS